MAAWSIQRLSRHVDRSNFDCGQPLLDIWLRERAGQFDRKDLARTFVATVPGEKRVLGYYALSTRHVMHEFLPASESKHLPPIDVPVVLLGRLAVDRSAHGQGLGRNLLIDALRRSALVAEHTGVRLVEVDAIDENARRFYLKFGFQSLRDDPNHLYLPLHQIRKLAI